jgi:hypothetical protein
VHRLDAKARKRVEVIGAKPSQIAEARKQLETAGCAQSVGQSNSRSLAGAGKSGR